MKKQQKVFFFYWPQSLANNVSFTMHFSSINLKNTRISSGFYYYRISAIIYWSNKQISHGCIYFINWICAWAASYEYVVCVCWCSYIGLNFQLNFRLFSRCSEMLFCINCIWIIGAIYDSKMPQVEFRSWSFRWKEIQTCMKPLE